LGNIPPKCFLRFTVTLLARPKKLDSGDHGCFASPSCDEQVIVGRKVVLIGFFWQSSSPIFINKSLCRAPLPTLMPKNCISWACTCAGCTHQQDIKRDFPKHSRRTPTYAHTSVFNGGYDVTSVPLSSPSYPRSTSRCKSPRTGVNQNQGLEEGDTVKFVKKENEIHFHFLV